MLNSTLACDVCTSAVQVVRSDVNMTNTTVAALSFIVKAACYALATRTQDRECNFIVDNIKSIMSQISRGIDNLQICTSLHIC